MRLLKKCVLVLTLDGNASNVELKLDCRHYFASSFRLVFVPTAAVPHKLWKPKSASSLFDLTCSINACDALLPYSL